MNLRDNIGKQARLIELPDGCTSKDYPVKVDGVYEIIDVSGCCYLLDFENGNHGFINSKRFELESDHIHHIKLK